MHVELPEMLMYLPVSHSEHRLLATWALYLPAAHASQEVESLNAANRPVVQAVHSSALVPENVPGSQLLHALAPSWSEYLPLSHDSHELISTVFANLPVSHLVQLTARESANLPCSQLVQLTTRFSALCLPALHGLQVEAPELVPVASPSPQSRQLTPVAL